MIACEISLHPSMLRSKLIKLIVFERREVRLLYIGVTGFQSHTSPTVFVSVLCLYCAYSACTMPIYNHPLPSCIIVSFKLNLTRLKLLKPEQKDKTAAYRRPLLWPIITLAGRHEKQHHSPTKSLFFTSFEKTASLTEI